MKKHPAIARNRLAHDRVAKVYDARHPEIFNEIEQARLAANVRAAVIAVQNVASIGARALDIGAGSGNLTRHLVDNGTRVTAADVSPECLAEIRRRFAGTGKVETALLDGEGLAQFGDASFEIVACYSVLHHVPDYVALVREMGRVVRRGGVVYIDHERNDGSWLPSADRDAFIAEAVVWPAKSWLRFVRPSSYWRRIQPYLEWRRWFDARYMPEGDLHIWPDDHIEWAKIEAALAQAGVRAVTTHDYLLYEPRYVREAWERWGSRITDTRSLIARKQ